MKSQSFTKSGPGRKHQQNKKVKKMGEAIKRNWIEKGVNVCDDQFIARFPDFSYEGSTALTIWRMSWEASRDALAEETPRIQLV
jgi:hypothetical protein